MIHGRIQIKTERPAEPHGATEQESEALRDSYNEAVMAEILTGAPALATEAGVTVVRVEIEHPGETWDESGDALEIDLSATPPTFATLPPYSEVAP